MDMSLERSNLELTSLSEEVFDQLLGDAPSDTTVNHNTILGGTKSPEEVVKEEVENKTPEIVKEKEEEEEETPKTNLEDAISEDDIENSSENNVDIDTASFLRSQYEGLVERGQWFPLEDEDLESFSWDEENFGKLIELQAEWNAQEKFTEKVESTGSYGKAIIEHIMNGGNPEDIITLFKEVKEIDDFDTSSKEGKEGLLRKYYVEELGWKENVFKKYLNNLIDEGENELNSAVEEAQKELKATISSKVEEAKRIQEENLRIQKEREARFANDMQTKVSSRKDIPSKEKNEILNSLLVYNQKLPDGRLANQFTIDFMKLQADPDKYIDLVMFVRNPEKYIKRIEETIETKVNKKAWNLIKNGNSLSRNTGSKQTDSKQSNKKDLIIDYKSLLKNS